jgi:beta-glucosidase
MVAPATLAGDMTSFPDGFLWGAATAGHQVEGGNQNSDVWETEWAENSIFAEPSGDACDHYHRYAGDIALLAGIGLNAYRFSVEWARVEPEPGFFSRAELEHYRRMVATCHEHGVTPVVTYNHFAVPRWFSREGSWNSSTAPDRFARYCEHVTAHIGDLVPWVCTLNEPNVIALITTMGVAPAAARERSNALAASEAPAPAFFASERVELMAPVHRKAVDAIKSGPGDARVGWTLALPDFQALAGGEESRNAARAAAELDWLEVSRDDDFVGVQTYTRERFGPDGIVKPERDAPKTQTGWEDYPEALGHSVSLAAEHAAVPVMVTENGMATSDDAARIDYTRGALEGLARAIAGGADVRGYLHWTLLDNFEWISGFEPTFGLIAVDRTTFARTVKPSARWLGEVARANAVP